MKKKSKLNIIKYAIVCILLIIVVIIGFIIYKNLFSSGTSTRYDGIENYKLTNKEIKSVEEKINELENIESVDVYINSKIIKIFVKMKEDIDFNIIKEKSNELLSSLSEDNLGYYDIEIFCDSLNDESEIYPQIGYKYKTSEEFSW